MRTQTKRLKTYSGVYDDFRLSFTPEPPATEEEIFSFRDHYSTELAYIQVFLNGHEATKRVPSGYILWILNDLLVGIPKLITGDCIVAAWASDPWRFEICGKPRENRVGITLHAPGRWIVMEKASVPLDTCAHEVIRLARAWLTYLDSVAIYHREIIHPDLGQQYRMCESYLQAAEEAISAYERARSADNT